MIRPAPLAAAAAALLMTACATTPQDAANAAADAARTQAKLDARLAGLTPGPSVQCIQPRNMQTQVFGATILYIDGTRVYRTQTTGGCFGLSRDDIIVTQSFGGSLCRGDLVRTVERSAGFISGACSFGDFVPYTRPRR